MDWQKRPAARKTAARHHRQLRRRRGWEAESKIGWVLFQVSPLNLTVLTYVDSDPEMSFGKHCLSTTDVRSRSPLKHTR
jgi:hypothetical protein